MSDKQEMIKKMIEMQKKFQQYETANGVDPQDYFTPESGHELDGYRQEYADLAAAVNAAAHAEVGSKP
ncbi:MAG: hypothetical protein OEY36_00965 [Gammaproteobacteria bacterium]|nr:hypothetical protein [Gammaproteobacteria bacterium]